MSALLFVFVFEILAVQKRKCEDINGLTFNKNNRKIIKKVQHADDCTHTLKDTNSLKKAIEIIKYYSAIRTMHSSMCN